MALDFSLQPDFSPVQASVLSRAPRQKGYGERLLDELSGLTALQGLSLPLTGPLTALGGGMRGLSFGLLDPTQEIQGMLGEAAPPEELRGALEIAGEIGGSFVPYIGASAIASRAFKGAELTSKLLRGATTFGGPELLDQALHQELRPQPALRSLMTGAAFSLPLSRPFLAPTVAATELLLGAEPIEAGIAGGLALLLGPMEGKLEKPLAKAASETPPFEPVIDTDFQALMKIAQQRKQSALSKTDFDVFKPQFTEMGLRIPQRDIIRRGPAPEPKPPVWDPALNPLPPGIKVDPSPSTWLTGFSTGTKKPKPQQIPLPFRTAEEIAPRPTLTVIDDAVKTAEINKGKPRDQWLLDKPPTDEELFEGLIREIPRGEAPNLGQLVDRNRTTTIRALENDLVQVIAPDVKRAEKAMKRGRPKEAAKIIAKVDKSYNTVLDAVLRARQTFGSGNTPASRYIRQAFSKWELQAGTHHGPKPYGAVGTAGMVSRMPKVLRITLDPKFDRDIESTVAHEIIHSIFDTISDVHPAVAKLATSRELTRQVAALSTAASTPNTQTLRIAHHLQRFGQTEQIKSAASIIRLHAQGGTKPTARLVKELRRLTREAQAKEAKYVKEVQNDIQKLAQEWKETGNKQVWEELDELQGAYEIADVFLRESSGTVRYRPLGGRFTVGSPNPVWPHGYEEEIADLGGQLLLDRSTLPKPLLEEFGRVFGTDMTKPVGPLVRPRAADSEIGRLLQGRRAKVELLAGEDPGKLSNALMKGYEAKGDTPDTRTIQQALAQAQNGYVPSEAPIKLQEPLPPKIRGMDVASNDPSNPFVSRAVRERKLSEMKLSMDPAERTKAAQLELLYQDVRDHKTPVSLRQAMAMQERHKVIQNAEVIHFQDDAEAFGTFAQELAQHTTKTQVDEFMGKLPSYYNRGDSFAGRLREKAQERKRILDRVYSETPPEPARDLLNDYGILAQGGAGKWTGSLGGQSIGKTAKSIDELEQWVRDLEAGTVQPENIGQLRVLGFPRANVVDFDGGSVRITNQMTGESVSLELNSQTQATVMQEAAEIVRRAPRLLDSAPEMMPASAPRLPGPGSIGGRASEQSPPSCFIGDE